MSRSRSILWAFALAAFVTGCFVAASPAKADGLTYQEFVNRGSGLCLTATGGQGSPVIQAVCATPGSVPMARQWAANCLDPGCSKQGIRSLVNPQLCLDALGSAAARTKLISWPCAYISNEVWHLFIPTINGGWLPNPNGDFSVRSLIAGTNSFCADVPGASAAQGVQLQIWTCNGTVAQLFFTRNP